MSNFCCWCKNANMIWCLHSLPAREDIFLALYLRLKAPRAFALLYRKDFARLCTRMTVLLNTSLRAAIAFTVCVCIRRVCIINKRACIAQCKPADSRALPLKRKHSIFSESISRLTHSLYALYGTYCAPLILQLYVREHFTLCRRFSFAFKMRVIVLFSLLQARFRVAVCIGMMFFGCHQQNWRSRSHLSLSICWGAYYIWCGIVSACWPLVDGERGWPLLKCLRWHLSSSHIWNNIERLYRRGLCQIYCRPTPHCSRRKSW